MKSGKPRPRGRPSVPADKAKSARYPLRLTQAQAEKLELLGGAEWIRSRIDGARLPSHTPTDEQVMDELPRTAEQAANRQPIHTRKKLGNS